MKHTDDEVSLAAEERDIDAMLDVRDAIMSLPENYIRVPREPDFVL